MIFLCHTADVPTGGVRRIARGRNPAVAVFEVGGRYHVTDDRCTHGKALLSRGTVVDGRVVCPLHAGSFDLETGAAADLPCTVPLTVYAIEIRDDAIYANVPG